MLRSLFEKRYHPSQEPPNWMSAIMGWEASSGVTVTPENALTFGAVFAAVRVLSETLAMLPLITYRRLGARSGDLRDQAGKVRAVEHPFYEMLHLAPNEEMTSFNWRECQMVHLNTWGNAYAYKVLNGAGRVAELWPLRPDKMKVKRRDGVLWYEYRLPKPDEKGRTKRMWTSREVLHIPGLGFDGVIGYSPIRMFKRMIGIGLAAEEYGSRFYANDARPGGVLEHPGELSQEAQGRLLENWNSRHQALDKKHRIGILEEGMTFKEIGLPPEDAQFLSTRKFQVEEVARIFRIPPHMLADLERATFSNIEHQSLNFVMHTMMPWLRRWEQRLVVELFTKAERKEYFVEFLVDGLLRGDIESRYKAYSVGRQWGWLNADDVRAKENMNALPNGQGEVYLVPFNMAPAGSMMDGRQGTGDGGVTQNASGELRVASGEVRVASGEVRVASGELRVASGELRVAEDDDGDDGDDRERRLRVAKARHRLRGAQKPVLEEAIGRVFRREKNDVGNKARRFLADGDVNQFYLWLEEFYRGDNGEFTERMVGPVMEAYAALARDLAAQEAAGDPDEYEVYEEETDAFTRAYVGSYAARQCAISQTRVQKAVQGALDMNEDAVEAVEGTVETWDEGRASGVAEFEATRLNNAMALTVYALAGVVYKVWTTVGENCSYCNSLDGKRLPVAKFYFIPGEELNPDGADKPLTFKRKIGHAPAHAGCDCIMVAG